MNKASIARISLLLIAFSIPLAIFLLQMISEDALTLLDWHSPFYVFTLQFGIGTLLFIKLSKNFAAWVKDVWRESGGGDSKLTLAILSVVIITVIAICIFWIEGRSRVQVDESVYLVVAQNLYYNQTGAVCYQGVFANGDFECFSYNTIKPRGLSYLYMLGMPIFGADLHWVYNFQTFILFLTLPVFFFAILAWTKNRWLSLLSAALLANCPALLFLSRSSSIEGLYVFMLALSLLFLKWACDRNTLRHWILLALTLAFLAQTRTEAALCLFAFIGVVGSATLTNRRSLKGILRSLSGVEGNSPFPAFLATLSAFCIPVLCTISLNRNSDLQGGAYGARGHLLGNIVTDFKLMAFPHYSPEGFFSLPYFPYFTWFTLLGFIALIILILRKRAWRGFAAFLLLLSSQYIVLFDSVSADLRLDVQQRFVLVILPAMSFLGALFIWQICKHLKNLANYKNAVILIILVMTINTLAHYGSFKNDILHNNNTALQEYYQVQKWVSKLEGQSIFFAHRPVIFLDNGLSAYKYNLLADVEENSLNELLEIYGGNVFAVESVQCKHSHSVPKMMAGNATVTCDAALSYFDVDTVLNVDLAENDGRKKLLIYKILGLKERDKKGLLRLFDKAETWQRNVRLIYRIPRDTSVTWKVQHFLNDEFIKDVPYAKGYFTDSLKLSQFTLDTNIWRLDIIDTITNEKIHSDFWELIRVGGAEKK